MGDLTFERAQQRVRTALQQRLETTDSAHDTATIYEETVDRLLRIAIDEEELDRVAHELAVDPDAIEWPDFDYFIDR